MRADEAAAAVTVRRARAQRTGTAVRRVSPEAPAHRASSDGSDALVTFFEFTEAAWDDLMTRPWITQVSPPEAFPGDTLVVRGSRFTAADVVVVGGTSLASTLNADESLSVTVPMTIGGGEQQVFVRRADGTESNRVNIGIKPELGPSAIRSLRAQR